MASKDAVIRNALHVAKTYRPTKADGGQLYHGSRTSGIGTLRQSKRGPLGPGVYASPHRPIAERYADTEGTVYSFDSPTEIFHGMRPWGSGSDVDPYKIWRRQAKSIVAVSPPEKQREIAALFEKLGPDDGYPLYYRLAQMMGSDEAAQALFRRAGYKGMTGYVDGPEVVLFDEVPLTEAEKLPQDNTDKATGGRTGYGTGGSRSLSPMGLYSKAAEVAQTLPMPKAIGQQMIAMLADPKRGTKKDELVNAGLLTREGKVHPDWANRIVTREELAQHLQQSMPHLEEINSLKKTNKSFPYSNEDEWANAMQEAANQGDNEAVNQISDAYENWLSDGSAVSKSTKYESYTLPNGNNYREVLLHTPKINQNFQSSHWDEPNVVAHLRMKDRTGPNGEKVLHVEEIQSDWGQKGRDEGWRDKNEEEFSNLIEQRDKLPQGPERWALQDKIDKMASKFPGHPTGPYVTSTEGYTDLALKRALQEAVKGGYDKLVISPGQANADLYGLSNDIDALSYDPDEQQLSFKRKNGSWDNIEGDVKPEDLPRHIGKDYAKALLNTQLHPLSGNHILENIDTKIGGEGMRKYYDKDVPQRLSKLVAGMDSDAKVQMHNYQLPAGWNVPEGTESYMGHSLDITDKIRDAVNQGLPAFKRGGTAQYDSNIVPPEVSAAMELTRRKKVGQTSLGLAKKLIQ